MLNMIHTPSLAIAQVTLHRFNRSTDTLNVYGYPQCQCPAECNQRCVLQTYFGSVINCHDLDQHFQVELVS